MIDTDPRYRHMTLRDDNDNDITPDRAADLITALALWRIWRRSVNGDLAQERQQWINNGGIAP